MGSPPTIRTAQTTADLSGLGGAIQSPSQDHSMKMIKKSSKMQAPTLRPPTLMIDLLFGALMLMAFQMGDPNTSRIVAHDFDIPTSDEREGDNPLTPLFLKPIEDKHSGWTYETADGRRLNAEVVAQIVRGQQNTPILLVSRSASVQSYLDAEQPLRLQGLDVGLAVALEGENNK